jgi:hypothetical protein
VIPLSFDTDEILLINLLFVTSATDKLQPN